MPRIEDMINSSIRKYGIGTMTRGEAAPKDYPRIPSGIFSLDFAIGGGFPAGVASCLWGPPGGGKSLVLQKVIACAQKLCFRCFNYQWDCLCDEGPLNQEVAIVATEVLDPGWARCLGVDINNLVIVEPDYGEQAADIISEIISAHDCGLVCLDSLAMLTPLAELEGSFGDAQVALQSRLVARMMRVVEQKLVREKKKGHRVTFIATNHIRSKIGQMFGSNEDVAGGWAAKHTWHLTLRMSQLSTDKDKETEMAVNAKFKASTVALANKRKIFTLQGAAEFFCTMADSGEFIAGTIPDLKTVEKYADEIDFIGRSPWRLFGVEYEKKSDILQALANDNQLLLTTKKKVIEQYVEAAKMERGLS